jgi:hypothetical protein
MPRSVKRTSPKATPAKNARKQGTEPASTRKKAALAPEYQEYLERHREFGEGRRKLSPQEFDELDDELLDLLENAGGPLSDDQSVRLQELEYLLIDTE